MGHFTKKAPTATATTMAGEGRVPRAKKLKAISEDDDVEVAVNITSKGRERVIV